MKVNIKTNIDPKLIARRTPRADHALALLAQKDTEPFVPALTGKTSNDTKVVKNKIIYPPPSQYLYHGKLMVDPDTGRAWASEGSKKVLTDRNLVFNRSMHGQAQAHWFEASKALNLNKWLRVYGRTLDDGD